MLSPPAGQAREKQLPARGQPTESRKRLCSPRVAIETDVARRHRRMGACCGRSPHQTPTVRRIGRQALELLRLLAAAAPAVAGDGFGYGLSGGAVNDGRAVSLLAAAKASGGAGGAAAGAAGMRSPLGLPPGAAGARAREAEAVKQYDDKIFVQVR